MAQDTTSPAARRAEITLTINGERRTLSVDTRTTLLDLLREQVGLTGAKKGCDHGQCGACTILLDGRRANACLALAVAHDGAEITTIEGLDHPLQRAFVEHDGAEVRFLGGGTTLVDLMRLGVETPAKLVDVAHLPGAIDEAEGGLR